MALSFFAYSSSKADSQIDYEIVSSPLSGDEIKALLLEHFSLTLGEGYQFNGTNSKYDATSNHYDITYTTPAFHPEYITYTKPAYQSVTETCQRLSFNIRIDIWDGKVRTKTQRHSHSEMALGPCKENMHWISHFGHYLPDMIIKNMTDSLKKWLNDSSKDQEFKQTYIPDPFPKYENLNSISFLDSINLTSWFFCYNFILKTDKDETFQYLDFIQTREAEFKALTYSSDDIETIDMKNPSMALEYRSSRCDLGAFSIMNDKQ